MEPTLYLPSASIVFKHSCNIFTPAELSENCCFYKASYRKWVLIANVVPSVRNLPIYYYQLV